jgi:hypothetical protein
MIGRGCRSQGKPEGRLFILNTGGGTKEEVFNGTINANRTRSVYHFDNLLRLINVTSKATKD